VASKHKMLCIKMKCPYCFSLDNKVVDKRETEDTEATRRRRECLKCGKRFTTYERIETVDLFIIKKDGRREKFDRTKIRSGIIKACEKRPISMDIVSSMVDRIEAKLRKLKKTEIKSSFVGEEIIRRLKQLDNVAYIRFASVYREFDDIKSFENELVGLKKREDDEKAKRNRKN